MLQRSASLSRPSILGLGLLLLCWMPSPGPSSAQDILPVTTTPKPSDVHPITSPSAFKISPDGRFVAFLSRRSDIIPGQKKNNNGEDLFLWDRRTNTVALISHAAGDPLQTGNEDTGAEQLSKADIAISGDARFIAYSSRASDLDTSVTDTLSGYHVYLYDRSTGKNTLIDRSAEDPTVAGDDDSNRPQLSLDGSVLLFRTRAGNLLPGQTTGLSREGLFHFDIATNRLRLVNRHFLYENRTHGRPEKADLSSDGSLVVFHTSGQSTTADVDTNGTTDVYVFSAETGENALLTTSFDDPGRTANGMSVALGLTSDGSVLFRSEATNLLDVTDDNGGFDVFLKSPGLPTRLISHRAGDPLTTANGESKEASVDAGGRLVAFSSQANNLVADVDDSSPTTDVFLYNLNTGSAHLLSHTSSDPLVAASGRMPSISRSGAWVSFSSRSDLLAPVDLNEATDLFLFETATGNRRLLTHAEGSPDTTAADASADFLWAAQGEVFTFRSFALNLTPDTVHRSNFWLGDAAESTLQPLRPIPAERIIWTTGSGSAGRMSEDGRFVLVNDRNSLIEGQNPAVWPSSEVFLFDRIKGKYQLLSRKAGNPLQGIGSSRGFSVRLSRDARSVAIATYNSHFYGGENNNESNIFLFDTETERLTLVSHAFGQPDQPANDSSTSHLISGDGSTVVYASDASDILAEPVSTSSSLYLYDRATGLNEPIASGLLRGVSDDGSRVLLSTHIPLTPDDQDTEADIYVWQRETRALLLVTDGRPGSPAPGWSVLSADGNHVAYATFNPDLIPNDTPHTFDIFHRDLTQGTLRLISHAAGQPLQPANGYSDRPRLSASGQQVIFESVATDLTHDAVEDRNIFHYDLSTSQMTLVTRPLNPQARSGASYVAGISDDGSQVLVFSESLRLLPDLEDRHSQVVGNLFKYSIGTPEPLLVNRKPGSHLETAEGPVGPDNAYLSGDGNVVSFSSTERDLTPSDTLGSDGFIFGNGFAIDLGLNVSAPASVVAPEPFQLRVNLDLPFHRQTKQLAVSFGLPVGVELLGQAGVTTWSCHAQSPEPVAGLERPRTLRCVHPPSLGGSVPDLSLSLSAPQSGEDLDLQVSVSSPDPDPDLGNNSVAVPIQVIGGDSIFADDFESGHLLSWSSSAP